MNDTEAQLRFGRLNQAYQACMQELQSHCIDTNPLVSLEIELFALSEMLNREIENQRAKIQSLRAHPALQD